MSYRFFGGLTAALAGLAIAGTPVLAQEGGFDPNKPPADRVPVTVVLVDEPLDRARPLQILRRTDVEPLDVIVLPRGDASAERLGAAMFTLLVTRHLQGDTAASAVAVDVGATRVPAAWRGQIMPLLGRTLERLRTAEPRDIPGLGRVRAGELWPVATWRYEELGLTFPDSAGAGPVGGTRED